MPVQAPSFYWEIEIVSYGDSEEDSGPIVSFGFATEAEKRDGAWTNPVGTCLFHKYAQPCCDSETCPRWLVSAWSVDVLCLCASNGRAVHYNGSSLLQWKSVRLDVALLPGETFTISLYIYISLICVSC